MPKPQFLPPPRIINSYNLKEYLLWTSSLVSIILISPHHNPVNWGDFTPIFTEQ